MKINYVFDIGSSKEDLYLIKDNLFAVFDGFNSLEKFADQYGKTGGLIAATITKDVFSQNKKDLKDLAIEANQKIKERMIDLNIDTANKSSLWGVILAAIRMKVNSFEWIQVGDSLVLIIYQDGSYRLLVDNYDHDKEVLKKWKELAEQKKENIREIINSGPLIELRGKANKTYGMLNGEEEVASFLKTGEENLQNIKHVLLFTDGLMIPKEDPLENDDYELFVKLFLKGGIKRVKDFVRNLQKRDPRCWKYPRYKQYDDIAAISISL